MLENLHFIFLYIAFLFNSGLLRAGCSRVLYLGVNSEESLDILKSDKTLNVSDLLGVHDALLEFLPVTDKNEDVNIVAKLYKKGNSKGMSYVICHKIQLYECIDSEKCFYYTPSLYKLFFQPFENELEGIQNIYYYPCGCISKIALEYLVDMKGQMLCEKYNVFRLSSPSVLASQGCRKKYNRVSIWGGIDFYSDLVGITNYNYADTTLIPKCNLGYLEESYRAAKIINEEIQQQGVKSAFYCDETATEVRFKSEQWNNVDVFFIETHGLSLNNYVDMSTQEKDNPMENHTLALAGASYVLEGGIVPDSIDDGILTAKEISELDMHNVDLAVVSACKSALGEIREDGVYGLMRGFKQAGVRSLIMATDDIVDYVSGQLWIQLFRNLAKGMTKREALLEGLKYIRIMDAGAFSHPKYWTPFILIDGVE